MPARPVAFVLVPLLALGASVAAARATEARQEASGRTSLHARARAWQAEVGDPSGSDPRRLAEFYAAARPGELPDPRRLADQRLLAVDVDATRRRGFTTHAFELARARGRVPSQPVTATLEWRRGAGTPWLIVGWADDR
jgi:hypothetical protein